MKFSLNRHSITMLIVAIALLACWHLGVIDPQAAAMVGFAGATLSATHPTLLDFKSRLDSNDQIADVIEILNQTNEMYDDLVILPGTDLTGIETSIRTGIPEPTFRKLYGGVQPAKSTTAKIREGCGMLENYAEVDKALADLNGNSASWRMSEERPILEGFGQKVARYLIYGNEATEPEGFTGLAPRYNSLSAQNARNILQDTSGSGSDNYTSIWLCVWSQNTGHGFYPKGSKAGVASIDKGQVTIENVDGQGGRMEAYRTHYRQDMGLVVRDWRYFVRIHYRPSAVTKKGDSGPVLGDLMSKAIRRLPPNGLRMGRAAFYMNMEALDAFDLQGNNHPLMRFKSQEDAQGKVIQTFRGIPVRQVDQILDTESVIA